jgi:hypothetical protein
MDGQIPASSQDKFLLPGELKLLESSWQTVKFEVFLDNGCNTTALIDEDFAKLLNIPLEQLPQP